MRSYTNLLAVAVVVAPTAPAFVVPHFHGRRRTITTIPPEPQNRAFHTVRYMAGNKRSRQEQERNIEQLQQEIDAAIRQREEFRQELEEAIRSFSETYESVNRNLQNADSRLEEETRSFQKQLENEKQIIDGMDEIIVEKMEQLKSIKASGGFLQEAFGALEGLQGALVPPVAALSVVALVGESVLRERKRALETEREIERLKHLVEAGARQQKLAEQSPLPGYAKAVRDSICQGIHRSICIHIPSH